jgi:hypothetical protein
VQYNGLQDLLAAGDCGQLSSSPFIRFSLVSGVQRQVTVLVHEEKPRSTRMHGINCARSVLTKENLAVGVDGRRLDR